MMVIIARFIALAIGYFCGMAAFTGDLFGKMLHVNIREQGSGNVGATNTLRALGTKFGLLALLGDCLKGVFAALLSYLILVGIAGIDMTDDEKGIIMLYAAFGAVIGHVFPAVYKFKGGKGVATTLGLVIVIFPHAIPLCFVVFVTIFLTTHYVSVGSITCAALYAIQVIVFTALDLFGYGDNTLFIERIVIAVLNAALIIWLHRANIGRLIAGNENKVYLGKNKGQKK